MMDSDSERSPAKQQQRLFLSCGPALKSQPSQAVLFALLALWTPVYVIGYLARLSRTGKGS